MDMRHRVYYYVNLNQNHKVGGWWNRGYDNYGMTYKKNLDALIRTIPGLKLRPVFFDYRNPNRYQLKVSCRWYEEELLLSILDKLPMTNYEKIVEGE